MRKEELFEDCIIGLMRPTKALIETTVLNFPSFAMGNIADDIANEWDMEYFRVYFETLQQLGCDITDIVMLTNDICTTFENMSLGNSQYDPYFWTPKGFENSPEWQLQREKASTLKSLIDNLTKEFDSNKMRPSDSV